MVRRLAKRGVKGFKEAVQKEVECPALFRHILVWYTDLRNRNIRGWRFEPIPFTEIEAFGRVYHLDMTPFDVDMIVLADALWQNSQPPPDAK